MSFATIKVQGPDAEFLADALRGRIADIFAVAIDDIPVASLEPPGTRPGFVLVLGGELMSDRLPAPVAGRDVQSDLGSLVAAIWEWVEVHPVTGITMRFGSGDDP